MRLSSKNIATTIMAVALPIVSMSAPGAGAQTASEKQTTQQSQTSKPSTTTSQPKSNQKDSIFFRKTYSIYSPFPAKFSFKYKSIV